MHPAPARAVTIDAALYARIAATDAPWLDGAMQRITRTADHGKLWFVAAAALALAGEERERIAARQGLTALTIASAVANLLAKPLSRRRRPATAEADELTRRHVPTPRSSSFPSGHTASAFAFATAAGRAEPRLRAPLAALAALVGYSRVHTGVHYPADVLAGALIGIGAGMLVSSDRRD